MPGLLIQRWVIGDGGFIGEVSLFEMAEDDKYVITNKVLKYVELSDLHVHPLRRKSGWAHALMTIALKYAKRKGYRVFLRAIPYSKPKIKQEALIAFYKQYGFKSTRLDQREMMLNWPTIKGEKK
jgi:ribosomal protein S18 acetylase RimI-like enzyme